MTLGSNAGAGWYRTNDAGIEPGIAGTWNLGKCKMRNTSKKKRNSHIIRRNKRSLVEVKAICWAAYFNWIYRYCHQSPTIKYTVCTEMKACKRYIVRWIPIPCPRIILTRLKLSSPRRSPLYSILSCQPKQAEHYLPFIACGWMS